MQMYINNNDILTLLLDEEDFIFSHPMPKNNNKRTDDVFKCCETEGLKNTFSRIYSVFMTNIGQIVQNVIGLCFL